jgi:hypothetical protein
MNGLHRLALFVLALSLSQGATAQNASFNGSATWLSRLLGGVSQPPRLRTEGDAKGGVDLGAALGAVQKGLGEAKKPEDPKKAEPTIAPSEYYVEVNGQTVGPLACAKLLELAQKRDLTPETRVWKAGQQIWRRAGAINEFDAIFLTVPPPVGAISRGESEVFPIDKPCMPKVPKERPWWKPGWWPFGE